jgi:Flp pilus assembly protein TadD
MAKRKGPTVSLLRYIDTRFKASDRATESARTTMEKRLEGMNEFRDQLKDQAARFVTREELNPMQEDLRVLRESKATLEGKASYTSMMVALALSAGALIVGLLNFWKA